MGGRHYGMLVLFVYAVPPLYGFILQTQQFFMMLAQRSNFLFKIIHNYCLFNVLIPLPLQS